MSLFAGSIFRIAVSSSRFSRSFSAATRILAEYGDRAPNPASNRLFISLNFDTSEHDLRAACEKYGVVRDTRVVRDRETQRSRGFGFVEFEDQDTATRAKDDLAGSTIDGYRVRVDYAGPAPAPRVASDRNPRFSGPPAEPSATLFFGNLPFTITTDELREHIAKEFGDDIKIEDIRFPMGRNVSEDDYVFGNQIHTNKGFGYVVFENIDQATAVYKGVREKFRGGWEMDGNVLRINYEQPRERRAPGGARGGFRTGGRGDRFVGRERRGSSERFQRRDEFDD